MNDEELDQLLQRMELRANTYARDDPAAQALCIVQRVDIIRLVSTIRKLRSQKTSLEIMGIDPAIPGTDETVTATVQEAEIKEVARVVADADGTSCSPAQAARLIGCTLHSIHYHLERGHFEGATFTLLPSGRKRRWKIPLPIKWTGKKWARHMGKKRGSNTP